VERDTEGKSRLHPSLAVPNVGIVLLRDTTTGLNRDLVTEEGCVLTSRAPIFEMLGDVHTCDALQSAQRYLFVTAKLVDTILLRSLGLAAAPIAGVSELDRGDLKLLCYYFGVGREPSERELEEAAENGQEYEESESVADPRDPFRPVKAVQQAPDPPKAPWCPPSDAFYLVPGSGYVGNEDDDHIPLTLVPWSPHSLCLAQPSSIKHAVEYLKQLANYRGLQMTEVMEWLPQDRDVGAVRFALGRHESGWAKDAILDSLYLGVRPLKGCVSEPNVSTPFDLAAAFEKLHSMLFADGDDRLPERRRQALREYLRIAGQVISGPMLREVQTTDDPLQQALWLQVAELQSAFLSQAAIVRARLLQEATHRSQDVDKPTKSVSDLLAVSSRIVAVVKELARCRESNTRLLLQPPRPKFELAKRFGNLDLVAQN
jgi:hypothetical protein